MANQDNFDHRFIDSDPTSVTIEFLRARLLAERAVSKTARAKLDGLTDKVAELEEQLKIVSLQRKKAEQATADVLAILELHGFTDTCDSDSEHDTYSHTHSVSATSLSWKGRRRDSASSDNIKEPRNRRHTPFDSTFFSSPRHRHGRSCRQIRRSESRTVAQDGNPLDFQPNGVHTKMFPDQAATTVVDATALKGDGNLNKLSNSNVLDRRNTMDINLERALENRAHVIGSFQEMEETQKEWEKKFTENTSTALDSCDVGNHSDVTDESNGEKSQAQAQLQGSSVVPSLHDTRSIANEVEFRKYVTTLPHGSPGNSVTSSDKCCKSCGSKSVEKDASPSRDKGNHISGSPKSESSHPQSCKGISEHSSTIHSPRVPRPNLRGGSFVSNATTIQKVDYPLIPVATEKSDTCDSVLTALKQAKLSLQEKVNSLHIRKPEYLSESSYPLTPASYMDTYALPIEPAFGTKSSLPASSSGSMVEFPVGCAGLFRVPTDCTPDASKRNNILGLSSQKTLVSNIPEWNISLLPGDQLFSKTSTKDLLNAGFPSQLPDTNPPLSIDDRPLTTPYMGGPKLWAGFRADGEPLVNAQESRCYKATPVQSLVKHLVFRVPKYPQLDK